MKITEQKLREAIRNGINKLNEAKSYDLDLENAREYEGVIGDAIKKLEGIDAYHKMAEDGGGTAVNSTASMIYISQYGKTDNTDALKKILKKVDSNLDVNNIKNNFDATDRERSGHDQDNDIWKYNIPKKIDYHKAKKMGILPEPNVTQMDHEVVGELLNMLAAYTSEGNPLANIAWRDLDSFMAAAHDYVRGSDWKKFKKDVETKYPVLEKRWNSDMMELSKIETWVRKSGMDYDDWEWDGKELTIFLKKGNPEKYSKEDLEEEGVFESKLNEDILDDAKAALENEYDWTNIEFEGDLSVRFDYDRGKNSMWVNKSGSISGNVPSRNARSVWKALDKLGLKENKINEMKGVKRYTKDGKEWTGATHKMPNGTLMTQDPHNKDSEELFYIEDLKEKKKKGLWDNVHAKRKRGEKPAKKGDDDYPDEKAWKDAQESVTNEHGGEAEMAKSDLFKISNYGQEIHDMLSGDENLPEWLEAKITKAADYLGSVKHYLEYEIKTGQTFEYGGSEWSEITSLQNYLTIDLDKFENGLKDSKHKATYKKARKQFMRVVSDVAWEHSKLHESKLNEGAIDIFTKDMNDEGTTADIFDAVGDGKTVNGQFTKKKWDDGVPVTKHLSRGGYNDIKTPKGKFQIIETPTFWYYEINNGWAAINKSKYGTPPFEY
jgi:hypothetical protein